jgi:DNA-binding PadR family transcriptional regulator
MGARVLNDRSAPAMRSPINWAVLGLLIERPGHGYDLLQRFDTAYAGALELSTNSQISGALKALRERHLIERLPADDTTPGAPPPRRIRYQASAEGLRSYEEWLLAWSPRTADAPGVFARQLAALPTTTALAVIDRYEQTCLTETTTNPIPTADGDNPSHPHQLQARLITEEKHLTLAAS